MPLPESVTARRSFLIITSFVSAMDIYALTFSSDLLIFYWAPADSLCARLSRYICLRHRKGIAVGVVKANGKVARKLQMLLLISAYRHKIGIVKAVYPPP